MSRHYEARHLEPRRYGPPRMKPWLVVEIPDDNPDGWQAVSYHRREGDARTKCAALNNGSVKQRKDMKSFKVEVQADNTRQWNSNQLRFATQAEALEYGRDLFTRWAAVRAWRVAEVAEAPTHRWRRVTNDVVSLSETVKGGVS